MIKKGVDELNHWLKIFTDDNTRSLNKTLHVKHKTEMSRFYAIKRKLIALGRIDSKKRVLSTRPVSEEEYVKLGNAYDPNVTKLIKFGNLVTETALPAPRPIKKKKATAKKKRKRANIRFAGSRCISARTIGK